MKNIIVMIAKSSSGKDMAYKHIMNMFKDDIGRLVLYYDRPMRENEEDGATYRFLSQREMETFLQNGVVTTAQGKTYKGQLIAKNTYPVVNSNGVTAALFLDDQILQSDKNNFLIVVDLVNFKQMVNFFKDNDQINLCPIYIETDFFKRIERYYNRENKEKNPNYGEVLRRCIADEYDFEGIYDYIDKDNDVIYNNSTIDNFLFTITKKVDSIIHS